VFFLQLGNAWGIDRLRSMPTWSGSATERVSICPMKRRLGAIQQVKIRTFRDKWYAGETISLLSVKAQPW